MRSVGDIPRTQARRRSTRYQDQPRRVDEHGVTPSFDPVAATQVPGRRQLVSIALGFSLITAASTVFGLFLIAGVAMGQRSGWVLAMLPAYVAVTTYFGVIAYGMWYWVAKGERWRGAVSVERVAGILNNTSVLPRRRRKSSRDRSPL